YKPYAITLLDVRKDDYIGTNTPRNYSSDIQLVDADHNVDEKKHIWMNNPLRYAGETFYQSGYTPGPEGEVSTLQVVKNTGWLIPYVACMIVVTGMAVQFGISFSRFLSRLDMRTSERASLGWPGIVVPVIAVLLLAGWLACKYTDRRTRVYAIE